MFPLPDRCEIPYLFFSSPVGTLSYNTQKSGGSPTMFNNVANALLAFEGVNKRLYVYNQSGVMTSYLLDGSDSMTTDISNVDTFAVDGRGNVIYYHHQFQTRIWMFNMTSRENIAADNLSSISNVKDLHMDFTNG